VNNIFQRQSASKDRNVDLSGNWFERKFPFARLAWFIRDVR